jgi:hypothetical protein
MTSGGANERFSTLSTPFGIAGSPVRVLVGKVVDQAAFVFEQDLLIANSALLDFGDDVFGAPLRGDDDDVGGIV